MSMIPDLSDRGLVAQFGDVMNEIPELYEAMRRFELENRPAVNSGGFKMRGGGMSVNRGGDVPRIRVGNARG
ncbi:hypothetical protein ELH02_14320 [Rhizobium ruizarguesonis]|uniref:hypothetical protein n=1 Tax=Rhizobium ruizarguesonis TaxID=2081791 RepID=UPI001031F20C|nr:hypothetical protein [Rhizobium ruizarguesonis]TBE45466.1 hypothetical protein ELH02_14320 [Rhizobium ruizarguesonis]